METIRHRLRVPRGWISYIRYTLESYDGMAVVSTVEPNEAVIEIRIAPGCQDAVFGLLDGLRMEEGLNLSEVLAEKSRRA
jgi:hypothetical protein